MMISASQNMWVDRESSEEDIDDEEVNDRRDNSTNVFQADTGPRLFQKIRQIIEDKSSTRQRSTKEHREMAVMRQQAELQATTARVSPTQSNLIVARTPAETRHMNSPAYPSALPSLYFDTTTVDSVDAKQEEKIQVLEQEKPVIAVEQKDPPEAKADECTTNSDTSQTRPDVATMTRSNGMKKRKLAHISATPEQECATPSSVKPVSGIDKSDNIQQLCKLQQIRCDAFRRILELADSLDNTQRSCFMNESQRVLYEMYSRHLQNIILYEAPISDEDRDAYTRVPEELHRRVTSSNCTNIYRSVIGCMLRYAPVVIGVLYCSL